MGAVVADADRGTTDEYAFLTSRPPATRFSVTTDGLERTD